MAITAGVLVAAVGASGVAGGPTEAAAGGFDFEGGDALFGDPCAECCFVPGAGDAVGHEVRKASCAEAEIHVGAIAVDDVACAVRA